MGRQAPEGCSASTSTCLRGVLAGATCRWRRRRSRPRRKRVETFRATGFGYFLEQSTRPQTVGYATLDSPVALAAWMLDHDTDSYYKISRAFLGGKPAGNLTREHIVDNVTTYWLTGTGASAARTYWENGRAQAAAPASGQAPPRSRSRSASPRSRTRSLPSRGAGSRKVYPGLAYFNEVDRGGHFAAWEEPELFASEMRSGVPLTALIPNRRRFE